MENKGRVILRCGECANYSFKAHKCMICQNEESDPRNPFYDDCPLPVAIKTIYCKECKFYEEGVDSGGGTKDICRLLKRQMQQDDFCSYGKRKGGAFGMEG